jgi:hypothetical protein
MSGPFTQAETETILKDPFQCSPVIIAVQPQGPDEPDKLRLCRHLSKGNKVHPSTNAYIDKEKFPTKFGSAAQVAEIVSPYRLLLSSIISNVPVPTSLHTLLTCSSHRTRIHVPNPRHTLHTRARTKSYIFLGVPYLREPLPHT